MQLARSAAVELLQLALDVDDVVDVLEFGKPVRRRKEGVVEKWLVHGKHIYNVVVVDVGNAWRVVHVGRFTKTKKKMRLMHEG
ncbi:MAG: hypothetical protein KAW41_06935 [Candidatus Diapherotrites archaeon]|nr:hypothetical protein [Candidatus Diapherotrites archaeon]